jgi:hypothetical protein
MTSEVLYSVGDRVATITLNRPEKLDARTPRMQVQLEETILRAAEIGRFPRRGPPFRRATKAHPPDPDCP